MWVFPSPFSLDICIVNCTKKTEGIQWKKAALNLMFCSSVSFEFSFCGGKDLHTPLQQTNSQLQNKKFEFTHNYFPRCFFNEQR